MQYFLRKGGKISATVCGMQHVENATPINFEITNVREQKIRERGVNHENHENIMPRKFGAIRYLIGQYKVTKSHRDSRESIYDR